MHNSTTSEYYTACSALTVINYNDSVVNVYLCFTYSLLKRTLTTFLISKQVIISHTSSSESSSTVNIFTGLYNIHNSNTCIIYLAILKYPIVFPNCTDCGPVANLSHGSAQHVPNTMYGATVYYTCDDGYEVTGLETRVCLDTGLWSGSQSSCTILGMITCYSDNRLHDKSTMFYYIIPVI